MNGVGARGSRGFVLVAVLALLVILSFIGATIALIAGRLRDEEAQRQRMLAAEIDIASTRATVFYLLATQRTTFGGLTVDQRMVLSEDERVAAGEGDTPISFLPVGTEIALDGTAYRGLGDARFSIQDDRGLLAVNWAPPLLLERFIERNGRAAPPAPTLVNRLLDYQDPDDLFRLNSAEREEYVRQGRPPPSNRTLTTPLELRRVLGWDAALAELSDRELLDTVTVARTAQLNVNTAPASVLRLLPGVGDEAAERVTAARALAPFVRLASFYELVGLVPVDEDLLSLYPLGSGTLRLWSSAGGRAHLVHWVLTPRDAGGRPWREDYEFTVPIDLGRQAEPRRVASPLFPAPDAEADRRAGEPQ